MKLFRPPSISTLIVAGLSLASLVNAQHAAAPAHLARIGTVNIQHLPPAPHAPHHGAAAESDVFLRGPIIDEPPGLPGPPVRPATVAVNLPGTIGIAQVSPQVSPQVSLSVPISFPALSQNGKAPPDTQLAAGTTRLIEMVNITGAVYTKIGNTQLRTFDLGQFFLGSQGQGTDPRILYDAPTGTFFAAYELRPAGGDDIRLALAADPGDDWTVYDVRSNSSGILFDQPKLGISDDKVMLSWNSYDSTGFIGTDYIVVQKAGLTARADTVPAVIWTGDRSRFQIVPVQSLSASSGVQYAAYHLGGSSNFHVMAFTGVPGVSSVGFTDSSYGIGSVAGPPLASQPSGGDPNVATNDDRLLSSVWQNELLWGAFNEGCTPAGDTRTRACERFVQVSTVRSAVNQNVQLQWPGGDVYFAAVSVTSNNDLFFGMTFSSPTLDPSAVVLGVPGGVFGPVTGGIIYQSGGQAYVCGCGVNGMPPNQTPNLRWGDYSAAARDPNDPTLVWVAQEYGGFSNPAGFWGTAIAGAFFAFEGPR